MTVQLSTKHENKTYSVMWSKMSQIWLVHNQE